MTADRGSRETVAELEATVEGLTEELVELKERVRLLEAEVEPDSQSQARSEEFGATKPPESKGTDEKTEDSTEPTDDDIIVA